MIVIGADTHKRTHVLAGVDADTGQVLSGRQIAADDGGHLQAVRWARNLSSERGGRSRIAGTSRADSRRRCWPPASA
jgi:hypothetical protein